MIPKIIHYCWFGKNPLSEMAQKCIESWKKYCPDYRIIEWNECNFDIRYNDYVKEAYKAEKWAFVADVVRLYVLVNYGGIYMDTDVELIKSPDELLMYEALAGFESKNQIQTGFMACHKGYRLFKELLEEYDHITFIQDNGNLNVTTNVVRITDSCLQYGLILNNKQQTIQGFTLLPSEYFSPKDFRTGRIILTDRTVCIHHFDGSWLSDEERLVLDIQKSLLRFLPQSLFGNIVKGIAVCKVEGFDRAWYKTKQWVQRKKRRRRIGKNK